MSEEDHKHFVCEYFWDCQIKDKQDPKYALDEYDIYSWIPYNFHKEMRNHRLSLRKNCETGKFELYRRFVQSYSGKANLFGMIMEDAVMTTNIDTGLEEIVCEGSFKDCLVAMTKENKKYHNSTEILVPCEHEFPNFGTMCDKDRYEQRRKKK